MPPASVGAKATGPLWVLLGLVSSVAVTWHLAVLAAAGLSSAQAPTFQQSLTALVSSPLDPLAGYGRGELPPWWLVWPLFVAALVMVAVLWWWVAGRARRPGQEGMATRRELRPFLGEQRARALAAQTRPRMSGRAQAPIEELTVDLGRAKGSGQRLHGSHEDSCIVVGGPRSFKTSTFIMSRVRDAPGPCVAVSTKADLLAATYLARRRRGRVWVWDPADVVGWPEGLRFSPVSGCEEPEVAISRAEAFAAAIPRSENTRNADFFEDQARDVLRCFLHAAALAGLTMREVVEWCLRLDSPTLAAREILRTDPRAAPMFATFLESLTSGDAREGPLDSTKKTLARLLAPFSLPRVMDACCPPSGDGFDAAEFLASTDTIYVMVGDSVTVTPLVTALVYDILRVARAASQRLMPPRLDPPLRIVIDEVGACPLPNMPLLMSDSGSRGITVVIGSHGLGQLRKRWGPDGAQEIFGSATVKLIMGGTSEREFLEDVSLLAGLARVPQSSVTVADSGGRSETGSLQDRPAIYLHEIRQLTPGTALLLYRALPPVVVAFVPYWESSWAAEAVESQRQVAELVAGGARGADRER